MDRRLVLLACVLLAGCSSPEGTREHKWRCEEFREWGVWIGEGESGVGVRGHDCTPHKKAPGDEPGASGAE